MWTQNTKPFARLRWKLLVRKSLPLGRGEFTFNLSPFKVNEFISNLINHKGPTGIDADFLLKKKDSGYIVIELLKTGRQQNLSAYESNPQKYTISKKMNAYKFLSFFKLFDLNIEVYFVNYGEFNSKQEGKYRVMKLDNYQLNEERDTILKIELTDCISLSGKSNEEGFLNWIQNNILSRCEIISEAPFKNPYANLSKEKLYQELEFYNERYQKDLEERRANNTKKKLLSMPDTGQELIIERFFERKNIDLSKYILKNNLISNISIPNNSDIKNIIFINLETKRDAHEITLKQIAKLLSNQLSYYEDLGNKFKALICISILPHIDTYNGLNNVQFIKYNLKNGPEINKIQMQDYLNILKKIKDLSA